jgi:hypothetical protein
VARERLWLSGIDVATFAIRAIDLSGLLAIPEKRGENTPADGRHGMIRTPRKKYNGRESVIEFWIRGAEADGTVPADPKSRFYENLRVLGQVLAQDEFPMIHQLPDGTKREIMVEVLAAVAPERWKHGDLAKVSVAFTSAEAFWHSQDVSTVTVNLGNQGTRIMTEFGASDAPIDDAVLTFYEGSGPDFYHAESGLFVAYDAVIPAGQTLIVDCGRKKLFGTGGLIPNRTLLRTHDEDGRWWSLEPVVGAVPSIRLEHGGGSTPMRVDIAARQKWMFG